MFSTGPGTPLYFSVWTPISVDGYAGTCIFLIVLGVILRSLVAAKSVLEKRWIDAELHSQYVVVKRTPSNECISSDLESTKGLLTENGVEKDVIVVQRHMEGARPWRITIDGPRAAIDTVIAGVFIVLDHAVYHADECRLFPLHPQWHFPWESGCREVRRLDTWGRKFARMIRRNVTANSATA
ncbi:hypothetical protein FOCG_18073 [Fusarium oxysporum f. sp. radicis-lycopersici 26381]|nr:hypothetical protein FOWG_17215 [Fusarium oxysporum f. sp. lycopersici MN25]EWZ78568.1 hypothetical protein FOWG_17215 [Fusarium oxysporum f. sp. lycopersici MN25]EXL39321.1 hypothetical protein FOCG_18073 [Fusarium oxysporum f. sp. radicis-lycopersici 26381]EXL39322.1 hypothetical protein FOCG_18073 [Fusarium oxysporum f. sp. radicis-lycopersici 26381]